MNFLKFLIFLSSSVLSLSRYGSQLTSTSRLSNSYINSLPSAYNGLKIPNSNLLGGFSNILGLQGGLIDTSLYDQFVQAIPQSYRAYGYSGYSNLAQSGYPFPGQTILGASNPISENKKDSSSDIVLEELPN